MRMEMGCFQRHGRVGGRERELFLFKRRRGGGEGIIPTFFLRLNTCDPAVSHPSYFLHEHVCVCVFDFFSCECVCWALTLSAHDWWALVSAGSQHRPRPDPTCSGHNGAVNMWQAGVCRRVINQGRAAPNTPKERCFGEISIFLRDWKRTLIRIWIPLISAFMGNPYVTVWVMNSDFLDFSSSEMQFLCAVSDFLHDWPKESTWYLMRGFW